jgi:hypothetical protein
MADTRIPQDTYRGVYPSVFKPIANGDVTVSPFQSYKQWTVLSGSATSSCLPLNGVYSDVLPYLETELTYNDAKNVDDSLQTVTYQSVNHLFYKYKNQPYNTLGPTDTNRTKKYLYQSASVLSFPYKKIGEGIKPASFTFTGSQLTGWGSSAPNLSIHSDRYGNLYNSIFPTESIVTGVVFYEGFNEYFDTSRITYESQNVTYVDGVTAQDGSGFVVTGLAANMINGGYIKTQIPGEYSRDTDYAISVWTQGSVFETVTVTGKPQLILGKVSGSTTQQYPFKLEVSSSAGVPEVVFSVGGGTNYIKTVVQVYNGDWNHIVCQKTGSRIELNVVGTSIATASAGFLTNSFDPLSNTSRIDNNDPLMIGGYGLNMQSLSGSIDELRIFNRALTSTEINYLTERRDYNGFEMTFRQTNLVGNIFSKQGIAVISTTDYRFHNILQQPYTASYRSTLTSYELGVVTKLDAGDFNLSLNPTLTADNDVTYHSFVTGSQFAPYITTIGLYNDAGQLLAVGKLAQPIRKRNDVDTNFLIRIDLDKNVLPGEQ